jgi:uncharacterized protein (DUF433 family)
MTVINASHLVLDEQGRALVAGTRTKVILIIRDKLAGMTPEQIREAYPYLSLADIYASLAYYYDHQAELDAQIAREDREVAEMRSAADAAAAPSSRAKLVQQLQQRRGRS